MIFAFPRPIDAWVADGLCTAEPFGNFGWKLTSQAGTVYRFWPRGGSWRACPTDGSVPTMQYGAEKLYNVLAVERSLQSNPPRLGPTA